MVIGNILRLQTNGTGTIVPFAIAGSAICIAADATHSSHEKWEP
jgi:hypothetical protein